MNTKSVFVDTSMFKALIDSDDEFHSQALAIWEKLQKNSVSLVTSNYILDESFTLIRARCGLEVALKFRKILVESAVLLRIVRVTVTDEGGAWKWFSRDWSGLSYTDCVSFALMERLGINVSATFDKHFERAGFDVSF